MATLSCKIRQGERHRVLNVGGEYVRDGQDWKRGRGYFGRGFIQYKGDTDLRIDLQIWGRCAHRFTLHGRLEPPLVLEPWKVPLDFGTLYSDDGKVGLRVVLPDVVEIAKHRPKEYPRANPPGALEFWNWTYRFTVVLKAQCGGPIKAPTIWQASQPTTYGGGLPDSNRRRH